MEKCVTPLLQDICITLYGPCEDNHCWATFLPRPDNLPSTFHLFPKDPRVASATTVWYTCDRDERVGVREMLDAAWG